MRKTRLLVSGFVIGGLVGLWFGFNIGAGQPVYANPFTRAEMGEQLEAQGDKAMKQSGETLQQAGEKLEQQSRDEP